MGLVKKKKLVLSIALNVLLGTALSVLWYLVYPQFLYRLDAVDSLGSYSVWTYRNDRGKAYFEVLRGPEQWSPGPHLPWRIYSRTGAEAFFVEDAHVDIAGDGKRDLLVREWKGSASGYGSKFLVLEVKGSAVKEIAVIQGLAGVKREDVNKDGVDELVGGDEAYDSFGGCCRADSPCPRVVLSFDPTQRRFALNKKLMAKPPLAEEQLRGLSLKYRDDPGWADQVLPPPGLFRTMFDLIYNGNEKQAWELFDVSWPEQSKFSKQDWKQEVQNALRDSSFGRVFVDSNKKKS